MSKRVQKISNFFLVMVLIIAMMSGLAVIGSATELQEEAMERPECYVRGDFNSDGEINDRDAVYLLWHQFFPENHPIKGDGDLNGDGELNSMDAVFALYAVLLGDNLAVMQEEIHGYAEPYWIWTEEGNGWSAKLMMDCGCGENRLEFPAEEIEENIQPASCLEAGLKVFAANVWVDDVQYQDQRSDVIPALGHERGTATCTTATYCSRSGCGVLLDEATGHNWALDAQKSSESTCKVSGKNVYVCQHCGEEMAENLKLEAHAFAIVADSAREIPVEGKTCEFRIQYTYKCECGEEQTAVGEEVHIRHTYADAQITRSATCVEEGTKTYTCTGCGDTKTEQVAKNPDAHKWNEVETAGGVTTHACGNPGCGATKSTVVVNSDEAMSKDTLQGNEIKLNNEDENLQAAMSMDQQTIDGLEADKDIKVTMEKVEADDLKLTQEQKDQLEGSTVYDFNMSYDDGEKIGEFDGLVTVSLPYVLEEGEDPENIAIWYIGEDGTVEAIQGSYCDGFVMFQTSHFSYYTVTRLYPEQRCALYGHLETLPVVKQATCMEDGYELITCSRCGHDVKRDILKHEGHKITTAVQQATCESEGSVVKTCENCDYRTVNTLPALGHKMVMDKAASVAAGCETDGLEVLICENGCGLESRTELPATGHKYEDDGEEKAGCTTNGHKKKRCLVCNAKYEEVTEGPTGHNYLPENVIWTWSEDNLSATATLVCATNSGHTKDLKAVVTVKTEGVSCTEAGVKIFSAAAAFNKYTYTAEKTVVAEAAGHAPSKQWIQEEDSHYRVCTECGAEVERKTHEFKDSKILEEPTCVEEGVMGLICETCGYESSRAIPATGHIPSEAWSKDEYGHFHVCTGCGEESGRQNHTYKDGEILTAPTCVNKGVMGTICEICGHESSREMPATGIHNYQNGICAECGAEENNCMHYRVHERNVDLSAYGVCEGTSVVLRFCDCGQDQDVDCHTTGCNMVEQGFYYHTGPDGIEYEVSMNQCLDCGLVWEGGYGFTVNPEKCERIVAYYGKVMVGDTVIAETYCLAEGEPMGLHPTCMQESHTLTMEQHGICYTDILVETCVCGECSWVMISGGCTFETVWDGNLEIGTCTQCGAVWEYRHDEPNAAGCVTPYGWELTIYNSSGNIVGVYKNKELHTTACAHREVVDTYFYGDDCEDGVVIFYRCSVCQREEELFWTSHNPYANTTQVFDLTGYNTCMAEVCQTECFCGKYRNYTTLDKDGRWCEWNTVDAEGNLSQCVNCATTRERSIQRIETETPCVYRFVETITFRDANGTVMATVYCDDTRQEHNEVTTYEMQGDTCEDGVIWTTRCTGCGRANTWETTWHDSMLTDVYDLSAVGCCDTKAVINHCPCYDSSWLNFESTGNGCQWEWVDSGRPGSWEVCQVCGIYRSVVQEIVGKQGTCGRLIKNVYSYYDSLDGEPLLTFEHFFSTKDHKYIDELELLEGAQSCDDGYNVRQICKTCGYLSGEWSNYGCGWYILDRQMVVEEGLCASYEVYENGCACGKLHASELSWYDGACNWQLIGFNAETAATEYECTSCGGHKSECVRREFAEGDPCHYTENRTYTFSKDGTVLGSATTVQSVENHQYVCTFELMGTTCEEGYVVTETCKTCGQEGGSWESWDCSTYLTDVEVLYIDSTNCGELRWMRWTSPCGEADNWSSSFSCNFYWDRAEDGWDISTCEKCGLTMKTKTERKQIPNSCEVEITVDYVFERNGEVTGTAQHVYTTRDHWYTTTFELLGTTCEDGYYYTDTCMYCGESYSGEGYGCGYFAVDRQVLCDVEGTCGRIWYDDYSCACGNNAGRNRNYRCSWETVTWEDNGRGYTEVVRCVDCGLEMSVVSYDTRVTGSDMMKRVEEYTFALNGETVSTAVYEYEYCAHLYVTEYELLGETCDDGYYVSATCVFCGETQEYGLNYGCSSRVTEIQMLCDVEGTCGRTWYEKYSCACGNYYYAFNSHCSFEEISWENNGNVETGHYRCVDCGLEYTRAGYDAKVPDSYLRKWVEEYTFMLNGEVIATATFEDAYCAHLYQAEFELLGETCEDGYYLTETCILCGDVIETEDVQYGCWTKSIGFQILCDAEDTCGRVWYSEYNCACGKNPRHEWNNYCNWETVLWESEDNVTTEHLRCVDCGLESRMIRTETRIPGTSRIQVTEEFTFMMNGETVSTSAYEYTYCQHEYIVEYELMGSSCTDGCTGTYVCRFCGYVNYSVESYDHYTRPVEVLDLYDGENVCGGSKFVMESCACGAVKGYYFDFGNHYHHQWSSGDEQGFRCYDCELECIRVTTREDVPNSCTDIYEEHCVFSRNGETLADVSVQLERTEHKMVATKLELMGETCEDGFRGMQACAKCGFSYGDVFEAYGHTGVTTAYYDLADYGICPGEIYQYSCACGKEMNSGWNLTCEWTSVEQYTRIEDDGTEVRVTVDKCLVCNALCRLEEYTVEHPEICTAEFFAKYIFISEGFPDIEIAGHGYYESHNYELTDVRFAEGSTKCEDGVEQTWTCTDCGDSYTNTYYYCERYTVEEYDLRNYGSLCGGYLRKKTCLCGRRGELVIEDTACDLDYVSCESFIEGAMINTSQNCIGGNWMDGYFEVVTCAVTDPELCGMKLRRAEYWLQDGCETVEYQTVQLGYNPETGTFEKEITVATGERSVYHPYEYTYEYVELDETSYEDRNYYNCPDCGSYTDEIYTYKYCEDCRGYCHYSSDMIYSNTLDNGCDKYYRYYYEDGFCRWNYRGDGHYHLRTLERSEWITADETQRWLQYDMTYDFSDGCRKTVTVTGTDYQEPEISSEDAHGWTCNWSIIQSATCARHGVERGVWTCVFCGLEDGDTYSTYQPNGHNWYWDEEKQVYVCYECDLECAIDASGSIVLEDISDELGNGSDYVVAYWNRGGIEFVPMVTVLMYDALDGEGDTRVLNTVELEDMELDEYGNRAIRFNIAQAEEAAAEMLRNEGYSGSYAIRLSFVPVNSTDLLDYAITFDTLKTA